MTRKLVVFDFDGVIVDSLEMYRLVHEKTFAAFGKKFHVKTPHAFKHWYDSKWENNWLRGGFSMKELPGVKIVFKTHEDYSNTKPFPGISQIVKHLARTFDLAIVSTTPRPLIRHALKKFGLSPFFKVVVASSNNSEKKKKLARVLRLTRTKPADAVIIGDAPSDIRAGKALGVKTIGVTYGWTPVKIIKKEKPDVIAGKPSEIPVLVARML